MLGVSHPISCLAGKQSNSITVQDGQCLLRMGGQGKRQYMCFDEAFFKNLEKMTAVTWSSFLSFWPFQRFEWGGMGLNGIEWNLK